MRRINLNLKFRVFNMNRIKVIINKSWLWMRRVKWTIKIYKIKYKIEVLNMDMMLFAIDYEDWKQETDILYKKLINYLRVVEVLSGRGAE